MCSHSNCYGAMFPDFTRLEKNQPLGGAAFSVVVEGHGMGVQRRSLEVKSEGWDRCVTCADYRTCYDLSLAKLLMNTLVVNGWYGA